MILDYFTENDLFVLPPMQCLKVCKYPVHWHGKGSFNNYVDKMRGGGGLKMSVFVHAQVIKTVKTKKTLLYFKSNGYTTLAGTDLLCMLNWGTQWTMVSYLKK